ncbi:MAG TPA: murein biosynthesis integral membrane protein MurJ [Thermodesulfovibrionales bacterium]|jgi:putative peptidoglycan lipid II flippase|nr:murein biosynthesis integral membrane protein MurJ [Thermodesulfovibrionales bacterium]
MNGKGRIARAAGVISLATLFSRILGYLKDMILARYFGATGLSDTFFVAFRIPNLLRELFAEGSMSSAFIPVLTEYQTRHGDEEARRLVRITFTFILLLVGLLCLAGIIFTPAIVAVIAPGFLGAPEKFSLTVSLTRTMFPFLLFMSLAALVMGALNTRRVFFIPALAPAFLNITTIMVVLLLVPLLKQPILSVALGVTLGGFVQFIFQLPSFFRKDFDLRFDTAFSHPGLRKMSMLILPATMGLAVAQINIFISTILASYLPQGSITYLYYSMRLIQFPVGIFGVAMGMAALPALSEHAVKGDIEKLREDFSFALRLLFFVTIPSMTGLIAFREPIVNTLFQRGAFDYSATTGTAEALLFYSLGIWAIVGVRVVTATFYSLQDTRTPVKIALTAMLTNVAMSLLLMGPLKHSGLAFANAIASGVNFMLLFYFLRRRLGRIDTKRILRSLLKTSGASFVMGASGWFILQGRLWQSSGRLPEKTLYLTVTLAFCAFIFFVISFLVKSDEMDYIYRTFKNKFASRF